LDGHGKCSPGGKNLSFSLSQKMGDQVLLDPLRGEIFRLSSYLHAHAAASFHRIARPPLSAGVNEYTIAMSRILVGPPPEWTKGPHRASSIVLVSNLPSALTDAQLKKECIESLSRPRFIYMHVADIKTGIFSGTAVIEFADDESATKAIRSGVGGCRARAIAEQEFSSLTSGEWPMLEHGPPQGVFSPEAVQAAAPVPVWGQPGRAPVSNPWQK
jgi:hypothetical protein